MMNAPDRAALDAEVRQYFEAFGRTAPPTYASTLVGLAGSATIDDLREAIRAELLGGARTISSAPAIARAAREAATAHRHAVAAPDCACRAYPDFGDTEAGGVQVWLDDGDGKPPYEAVARCLRCGRGPASTIAVASTAEREPGDLFTRERPGIAHRKAAA